MHNTCAKHKCVCIYIYRERERERSSERYVYVSVLAFILTIAFFPSSLANLSHSSALLTQARHCRRVCRRLGDSIHTETDNVLQKHCKVKLLSQNENQLGPRSAPAHNQREDAQLSPRLCTTSLRRLLYGSGGGPPSRSATEKSSAQQNPEECRDLRSDFTLIPRLDLENSAIELFLRVQS